jgi:hypothetical protein
MDRIASAIARPGRSFRALAALSVIAGLAMGFNFSIVPMTLWLDPSYVYAYNYAAAHGLTWGRDFISTYGPYGYLMATMDLGSLVRNRIVSSLFLAVGVGLAAAVYVWSVPGLDAGCRVAMLLALIGAFTIQDPEYQWLLLFLFLFLAGLLARSRVGPVAYGLASLIAGFCALIKLSLGVGALATLAAGCLFVPGPLLGAYRLGLAATGAAVGFLIGWTTSGGDLAGIGAFLALGREISDGYSGAMSLTLIPVLHDGNSGVVSYVTKIFAIELTALLLWFALSVVWVVTRPGPRSRLALAGLAVPLFLAWKHSIVRQDEHVAILARFGVFVVAILATEALSARPWRETLRVAGFMLLLLAVPWFTGMSREISSVAGELVVNPLRFQGVRHLYRLIDLPAYRANVEHRTRAALEPRRLPESMRQVIGHASVDVYPWDISYVPANDLAWSNRPLPASFNAYTPTLDGSNATFFESSKRPEYVLWHWSFQNGLSSIDRRHLFWDEPRTLRAILGHYDIVAAAPGVLLLRARGQPRFGEPELVGTSSAPWRVWVPVPDGPGVLLLAASVERPALVRLLRFLFRESAMVVDVRLSSGETRGYRVVPDNTSGGLWINPFAVTWGDLPTLLRDGTGHRVVEVQFRSVSRVVNWLRPSVTLSWYRLPPRPPARDGAPALGDRSGG